MKYIAFGDTLNLINDASFVFINCLGEYLGMSIFIFLLMSTIMNFKLKASKAYQQNSFGWIVIGISLALVSGLMLSIGIEYAIFNHINTELDKNVWDLLSFNLNPALVVGGILKGSNQSLGYIPIGNGILYIIFELLGAFTAALLANLFYRRLIQKQDDFSTIKACFYTSPSIKNLIANIFNEFFATFVFCIILFACNFITQKNIIIQIFAVFLIISAIGYSLGGVTGYALNPWRDFGPRLIYYLIYRKKEINKKYVWNYSAVPIIAPIIGTLLATIIMPGFIY